MVLEHYGGVFPASTAAARGVRVQKRARNGIISVVGTIEAVRKERRDVET